MSSSFDYDEVAAYILDALQQVLPGDFAYIALQSPVNIIKTRVTGNGELAIYESTLKSLENPIEQLSGLQIMLNTRQPLLVSDTRQRDDWQSLPEGESLRSFLGVPIFLDEEMIGFIGLRSREENYFREAHIPRLQYFASQIAAGIHNARNRLQSQAVAITENRRQLANELHDSVTQALFASTVVTKVLLDTGGDLPEGTKEHLTKLRRLNQGALAEMRTLLLELRQTDITTVDLPDLMQQLATAAMGNSPANVEATIEGDAKLPDAVHVTFYRVAQEALNNITKHASATQVELHLTLQPDRASLVIRDNGRGFDPHDIEASHFGLDIMRERAVAANADLKIESEIGIGTTISLEWKQAD